MLKPLSDDIYKVRVPVLATLTPIDLHFGIRVNMGRDERGRNFNDKGKNHEWTTTWLKLEKLIEIFDNGFPIRLVNQEDVVSIYNELERYVSDMGRLEEISINGRALYDDRVNVIARFVNEIYGHNQARLLKEAYNIQYMGKNISNTLSIEDTKRAQGEKRVEVIKPINGSNPFEKPTPEQLANNSKPANVNADVLTYRPPVIVDHPVAVYDGSTSDPYIQQINALPSFGVSNTSTSYRKTFKI